MKTKAPRIFISGIIAIGAFSVGWYLHQPITAEVEYTPDFTSHTPFLALTYDQCPPNVSVPDEYTCIYNLAYSTLNKADTLANKLLQTSSTTSGEKLEGFYDSLHKGVQSAQKARDDYFNAVCEIDSMLIYGGTGILSEQRACQYYYADQYLNVLKSLEKSINKN